MMSPSLHPWNVSPVDARRIQDQLRSRIIIGSLPDHIHTIAGADVSFNRGSNLVYAGIVILTFPELNIIESVGICEEVDFPYIPGLLAFREGPPVLHVWEKLKSKPDVIVFDAQGLAHPRRMGLATHLGILMDIPSIGCAKTVLVGKYREPERYRGDTEPLIDKGEIIGMVVRTKSDTKPVFISVGHRVNLNSAVEFVLKCATSYRIPEPTRQAHLLVNRIREENNV